MQCVCSQSLRTYAKRIRSVAMAASGSSSGVKALPLGVARCSFSPLTVDLSILHARPLLPLRPLSACVCILKNICFFFKYLTYIQYIVFYTPTCQLNLILKSQKLCFHCTTVLLLKSFLLCITQITAIFFWHIIITDFMSVALPLMCTLTL